MNTRPHSILYICQNAIGDIITELPGIHFLHSKYPSARVDVCINRAYSDLLCADPHVNTVICVPESWFDTSLDSLSTTPEMAHVFTTRYDIIVDAMCTAQTAHVVEMLAPETAVGIAFKETNGVYDRVVSMEQRREWASGKRTASECFGDLIRLVSREYVPSTPVLHVTPEAQAWGASWLSRNARSGQSIVALNPGAGHQMKRWPMEHFFELARGLEKHSSLPLFIFGPKETELFQAHAEDIKASKWPVYRSENTHVQPLAGILRCCALLVSNDCAVMHIGAAVGCRVIGIFGPSNSRVWFPYPQPWNQVIERDANCRETCQTGCESMECLTKIQPEDILSKALMIRWPMMK